MFSAFQEHLIATFLPIVGTAIATFLAKRLDTLFKTIERRHSIDIDDRLEGRFKDIVKGAVGAVEQSYVQELKKSGKFKKEQHAEALQRAINIIKKDVQDTQLDIPFIKKKSYVNEVEVAVLNGNGGT